MSYAVGQFVRWKRTGVVTRIRSFERVERSGQTGAVACAVLEINRLVPVLELEPAAQTDAERQQPRRTVTAFAEPQFIASANVAELDEPWFGRQSKTPAPKTPAPKGSSRAPATALVESVPVASGQQPVDVLALDFMNLLVRAFHAGKPTETHAVRSMFQTIANTVKQLRPSRIVFAMESGHDLRSKLLPEYKAHRPPQAPELRAQVELAKQAIATAGLSAFAVPGWEADDVLASIVERFPCVVICSADKDLLSLHGRARVFQPWSGGGFVDPETKLGISAGQVTDYLALCGDTSDGIPGVRGIGPKTAVALLAEFGDLEAILVAASSGKIAGTTGEKLRTQRAQALLCQQVVQLRASLPLPALDCWNPPAGYQTRLQSLGLGAVAAVLDGMRSHLSPQAFSGSQSVALLEAPQAFSGSQSMALEAPKVFSGSLFEDPPLSAGQDASPTAVTRVLRSISEPIRSELTLQQRWEGPDRGMISCWETGRSSQNSANPWKRDSPHWVAFDMGQRRVDLDILLTQDRVGER